MKDTYIYPAIFHRAEEGGYWIEFPDLPGANTQGDKLEEALYMAKDCLAVFMSLLEESDEVIPEATIPYVNELEEGDFTQLIEVYMPPYRDEYENKVERRNVTIPRWLNRLAKEKNINCSSLLVAALKKHLGY
ncbi:type II toxin-antitoxin system HicB family antitoxin [Fusobacterium ulcerans]|uniref:type II toxin-antitoxin system HicB family antitoxin n=1 Tax=Fusobacterium ulcerans TaxID=861 RepID=UPI0030B65154